MGQSRAYEQGKSGEEVKVVFDSCPRGSRSIDRVNWSVFTAGAAVVVAMLRQRW